MSLEEIKANLLKKSKGDLSVLSESEIMKEGEYLFVPTYDLNRILSGSLYKSVRTKTLTFMVAPEASGKSSFMALNLSSAQKKGYLPLILDTEMSWTPEFCKRWGLDPENAIILPSPWIEEILVTLTRIIDDNTQNLAICLDSLGAIESLKMIKDGVLGDVKADQGGLQRKIKRLMKVIVAIIKRQNSIGFVSGHFYGDPSGYGDPEKIGGGKYPKLAADYTIILKKDKLFENPSGNTLKEKGKVIGTEITAGTIKNRLSPPFQEAKLEIIYNKGVNKFAGIVPLSLDMGLITRGGSWYTCELLDLKIQGEKNLYLQLEKMNIDPLLEAIEKILQDRGYSNVNNELESILNEDFQSKEKDIFKKETNHSKKNI